MSGSEPFGSIDYTALMLATEACALGDCLVYDTALGNWRVASAANRTTANTGTQAIARSSYGGSEIGKVKYQVAGVLAQSVSGLAVLTPSNTKKLVRTSTAGRLERIDSYTTGDDIVGYATWDGRVALHLGLPWEYIATFAGVPPSLPQNSIQYYATSTTLGGAAHASISSSGFFETRSASEAVSTNGHWNTGYNVGTIIGSLDAASGTSRNLLGLFQSTAGGPVLGNNSLGVMSVVGDGMVLNARTAEVIMNAAVYDVLVGTPSLVLRHEINSTAILNGHPRHGLSTAWGASEGEVDISSTGTYSLTSAQYKYAIWRLTGAATGTYTIPVPTNIQSYVRYVEETGGYDKVITKGSGTTYTLKANTSRLIKVTANGVYEIGAASSSVNYRKDVVGAGASLGYVDLTVNGKDATTLNINVSSGSGDCDGFAHDLVDPETMVLTVIITLNGGGAEGGGSGTFAFNALAGATAAYMIRDFDGSSNDIVIGINSVIQFVWDGNGWRLISSVAL